MPEPEGPPSSSAAPRQSRLRGLLRRRWVVAATAGVVVANVVTLAVVAGSPGSASQQSSCGGGGYFSGGGSGSEEGCPADLSIKQYPSQDPIKVGSRLFYLIEATNNGPGVAFQMRVVDRLPLSVTAQWSLASSDGYCQQPVRRDARFAGFAQCYFYYIEPGQTVAMVAVVVPNRAGTIKNLVDVSSGNPDPDTSNNTRTKSVKVQ